MTRLYVVVRGDLPAGLQMAQACHAARAYPGRPEDENLIVLTVPDQRALWWLLVKAGMPETPCTVAPFAEPDLDYQLTALALSGPGAKKLVHTLPLAGAPTSNLT